MFQVLSTLPDSNSNKAPVCVKKILELVGSDELQTELVACTNMFGFLPVSIAQLESNSLSLDESLHIIDEVSKRLKENRGERAKKALEKHEKVLEKNKGKLDIYEMKIQKHLIN